MLKVWKLKMLWSGVHRNWQKQWVHSSRKSGHGLPRWTLLALVDMAWTGRPILLLLLFYLGLQTIGWCFPHQCHSLSFVIWHVNHVWKCSLSQASTAKWKFNPPVNLIVMINHYTFLSRSPLVHSSFPQTHTIAVISGTFNLLPCSSTKHFFFFSTKCCTAPLGKGWKEICKTLRGVSESILMSYFLNHKPTASICQF